MNSRAPFAAHCRETFESLQPGQDSFHYLGCGFVTAVFAMLGHIGVQGFQVAETC